MSCLRHPLTLFSLSPHPENERAKRTVAHPDNHHYVSQLSNGVEALDIGFHIRGKSSTTLATLGRGAEADIFVEGCSIARVQCSFEIDLDTNVVMFFDRSHGCTTQISGENATPFEYERVRKVLVQKNLNTIIRMGGARCDLVVFELEWHQDPTEMAETIKKYDALPYGRVENPRLARTVDEEPTNFPSRMKTRPHTPMPRQLKIRYVKVGPPLGSGMFGTVHKVIDVDSGKFMAVKIIEHKVSKQQPLYNVLKREVEALSGLGHPHIVNYIASQGWDEPQLEIFMGLKEGSLNSLIESGVDVSEVANSVFPQMLKALDFIACKGIVHRDVKPDNILFISQPEGQYQFHLGDFGLCNRIADAKTFAGTSIYMAPEMLHGGAQTHKVDVWSLFVTMLWILDAGGLRQKCNEFTHVSEVQRAVLFIASNPGPISSIREMAIINSVERASAAQMLVKHFDGAGLSTPRNQVPALIISPSATAKAPLSAPFNKKSRIPQRRPEKLRMHGNIFGNSRHKNPHKSRQIKPASQLQGILPKPTDQELDC